MTIYPDNYEDRLKEGQRIPREAPPLPEPDTHCWDEDKLRDSVQPKDEPVAPAEGDYYLTAYKLARALSDHLATQPAAPPAQPAQAPLTDEQSEVLATILGHYGNDPRVQCLRQLLYGAAIRKEPT